MFDFNNIEFIKTDAQRGNSNYSFVGLKRKENSEKLEFWLPLGFDSFITEIDNATSFDRVKNFFFKMYRTFQIYKERKLLSMKEEELTSDRDGVFEYKNGFSFVNENKEQVVFYGKLNALDKILEGYDELRISSLEKKHSSTTEIDYSKIDKYLHQAIFLEEDVIYLDKMNIAKHVLLKESPPIVQIFCFIYTEIKKELEEIESISDRASNLADSFKENYLQPDSSLFSQNTFAETINILKNTFEEIDSKTTYKDEDFWHFYDAVDAFLSGERKEDNEGIYFGISSFYDVWEDMCQSYMISQPINKPKILYADVNGELLGRKKLFGSNEHEPNVNPFKMEINRGYSPRFIKPDLVLDISNVFDTALIYKIKFYKKLNMQMVSFLDFNKTMNDHPKIIELYNNYGEKIPNPLKEGKTVTLYSALDVVNFENDIQTYFESTTSSTLIIDYKYMRKSDYQKYNPNSIDKNGINKVKEDIHKQLIYEWTVQNNFGNLETHSQFWIPYFDDSLNFDLTKKEVNITNLYFLASQIKIVQVNFKILQENYLKLFNV